MKKIYLCEDVCGGREFVTVDYDNMVLRWYAGDGAIKATSCDCVEDDSSWDNDGLVTGMLTDLTSEQIQDYLSELTILDERLFI